MFEVRCITREEDFAELEGAWSELLVTSAANNPFLTHQWLHSWWLAFGAGARLHIMLCYERRNGRETLVGIFPGYVRSGGWYPSARRLRLLGSEVVTSDFLDVIVARECEEAVLRALFDGLHRDRSIDLLEMTDLGEGAVLLSARERLLGPHWQVLDWPVTKLCPTLPLPANSADYFAGLSRGVRKNYQYYLRKLHARGVSLEVILEEKDLAQGIADFIRLHNLRRRQKNQAGIFSTGIQRSFYHDVFTRFFNAGWLELAFLEVGGERIAGVCQFNYNGSTYYYQTGYDIAWEKSSAGFVLSGLLIERAISQRHLSYEFLRGEEEYKYRLGATQNRRLKDVFFRKGRLIGEIFLAGRRLARDGRAAAKAVLRPVLNEPR